MKKFFSYVDPDDTGDESVDTADASREGHGSSAVDPALKRDDAHRTDRDTLADQRAEAKAKRQAEKEAKAAEKAAAKAAEKAAAKEAKQADKAAKRQAKPEQSAPVGEPMGVHEHHSHTHAQAPAKHDHIVPSGRESGALRGLMAGMATTAKTLTKKVDTQQYPDVKPELPPRSRGVIALLEENCTVCMLCARECPDWCLYIDSHKETVPSETPGGRDRQRNVLDRFAIDFSLCMYCGICIEACPFDALFWTPEFEYASTDIRDLLHEKDQLGEWMRTVPAPPDLDASAPEAGEVAAANKPARVVRRRVQE